MFLSAAEQIPSVIELLSDLNDDSGVPKNVRSKLQAVITILGENDDLATRASKALDELDQINEDTNLQQYIRTQIWNVVSILSKIN